MSKPVCDVEPYVVELGLNIPMDLYRDLNLSNNDTIFQQEQQYSYLTKEGNNVYTTDDGSIDEQDMVRLKSIINTILNDNNYCPCIQSNLNLIKFVVADPQDSYSLRRFSSSMVDTAAFVVAGSNTIVINRLVVFPRFSSGPRLGKGLPDEQLEKTLRHEIVHALHHCYTCRDVKKNKQLEQQIDKLYDFYIAIHNDLKRFHNQFEKDLLALGVERRIDTIGIFDIKYLASLDYAKTNRHEFLAEMAAVFCYSKVPIFNSNAYRTNNPFYTEERLEIRYKAALNLQYRFFINNICNLFDSLFSDVENCSKSFIDGVETRLYLNCISRENLFVPGSSCKIFNVQLSIMPDAGCCDSEEKVSDKIDLGKINLHDPCSCLYVYNLDVESRINKILLSIYNCSREGVYPVKHDEKLKELSLNIDEQIFNALNNRFNGSLYRPKDIPNTKCN